MDLTEKKLALFDAHLSHKGLQHLVDVAASLLGNPIFMADLSMSIVFKSSDMGPGALDFSAEDDPDRQLSLARQAADAGYLDWIYHHDAPVTGSFAGQPRYLSARVRDGSQVLGHIVVSEAGRPFSPDDEELLPVVCQTIAFELRRMRPDDSSIEYGPLLRSLVDGAPMEDDVIRRRMAAMGHQLPATLRLLVMRPTEPSRTISLTYLRSQLLRAFRGSVGIVREDEGVHVVDGSIEAADLVERLRSSVYLGGLSTGMSWPLRDAGRMGAAYRQADAALRLSADTESERVVPYDDVVIRHVGELAVPADEGLRDSLVHPKLRLLASLDERDGTDLVGSLAAYLNGGRNVARAARDLHVHKNSVYYRLQRIGELTGIDMGDEQTCFLMQFSLALMGRGPTGIR